MIFGINYLNVLFNISPNVFVLSPVIFFFFLLSVTAVNLKSSKDYLTGNCQSFVGEVIGKPKYVHSMSRIKSGVVQEMGCSEEQQVVLSGQQGHILSCPVCPEDMNK